MEKPKANLRIKLPRPPSPVLLALLMAVSLVVVSALLLFFNLIDTVLYIFAIPIVLSAMWYEKRFYLVLIAMASLAVVAVVAINSQGFYETFTLISASVSCALLAELVFRLTRSRRQAERDLRFSEAQSRLLSENMNDIIARIDPAGVFQHISPSCQRVLGLAPEELSGKSFLDLLHLEDAPALQQALADAAQGSPWQTREFRCRHADGTFRWLEATGNLLLDDNGKLLGVALSMRDITDRRQASENLRDVNEKLTLWVGELEQRTNEAVLLSQMGEQLQSCLTSKDAFDVVIQKASLLFEGQNGALFMYSEGLQREDRRMLEAVGYWLAATAPKPPRLPASLGEPVFTPDDCWALRRMRIHEVASPAEGPLCPHIHRSGEADAPFQPYFCVPVNAQGETLGLLYIQVSQPDQIKRWSQLAVTVADLIALTLANIKLREDLNIQAIMDPVTRLFNRRHMEKTLDIEVQRAHNKNLPLSLVMLDIDNFKLFNDNFSYAAGDALLRELGFALHASMLSGEVACRYGGEEFILILPGVSLEDACQHAEKLRVAVQKMRVRTEGKILGEVTISLGVANLPRHAVTTEGILRAVDTALHDAKRKGRNKVVVAG
jgi:diguanylate cyclase (GGDEF)-like protein/PAS domain S-box-containing protein